MRIGARRSCARTSWARVERCGCYNPLHLDRANAGGGPSALTGVSFFQDRRKRTMTIKVGDKMPAGTLTRMTKDGPQKISTDELFKGKKVVLFSVPGAFTPTCDAKHLPGFVEKAGDIKAKGVDTIACMAVNDVFVMNAWGKHSNAIDKVTM